jgi:hypothetical protein
MNVSRPLLLFHCSITTSLHLAGTVFASIDGVVGLHRGYSIGNLVWSYRGE